ncbi:universal stress protein [Agrilactobacillus yilanensis]|uniref:Universal stress protein n=1 Tax=Agrilactobacillus yilanensis TaxID=2485997 RepID=A0ABW4J4M6_9LACO|nr:universal stress protein [Agrilactobacillus yilanensis]
MNAHYRNILIASDGSPEAQRAFTEAVDLAKLMDAKLYITHVLEHRNYDGSLEPSYYSDASDSATLVQAGVRKLLTKMKATAEAQGLTDVSILQPEGNAKEIIANELPIELDIDLIIIGATGRSRTERLLLGSVSDYIIRKANTQVLVVRDKAYQ